jgi:RNA polymerase sigma-70 factor (ECF subfamily)
MKDPGALASYPAVTPSEQDDATTATSAEALFRSHSRFVADFAHRLGVPRTELDDVVQEVFLTAHRRGGYRDGVASPTSWLGQITLFAARTRRRTERRRPSGEEELDPDATASAGADAFESIAAAQALARVQRALDALDLDTRAVFILYELEEEPCDAIAASLGVPVGTIYSRLHTARRKFQEAHDRIEKIEAASAGRRVAGRSR